MAVTEHEPTAAAPAPEPEVSDLLGEPVGIDVTDVVRLYRMGEVAVSALRGVSLKIAPGEFVAIMGPSGSGKSTLLSLIGGLDRPTQGTIVAGGRKISDMRDRALADYRLQHVGTIFQSFNLIPTLTAQDNVALPMTLAGIPAAQRRERAKRILEKVGLGDRVTFRPTRLSGGEQQRVSAARALANRPGLILADEPTGNLDEEAGQGVLALIKEMNRLGATVVMVTHDPDVAAIAQRTVRMRNGAIVEDPGSVAQPARQDVTRPRSGRLSWLQSIRIGVSSLRRRKLRTTLSSAGVAIGIFFIAIIVSFATGIQDSLTNAFAITGQLNQVSVGDNNGLADPSKHKVLDNAALARLGSLPHVKDAYGNLLMEGTLTTPGGISLSNVYLASGNPLNETPKALSKFLVAGDFPSSDSANEVMISSDTAGKLGYRPADAIGKTLTFSAQYPGLFIGGTAQPAATVSLPLEMTIRGIVSSAGANIGGGTAIFISAPYLTTKDYWERMAKANSWSTDEFNSITLIAESSGSVDSVAREARDLGYQATTTSDLLKGLGQFITVLEIGLSALAAVALFVACIGIANTMYTAVLERTREIGIMKALGARSADVRGMFLSEAGSIGLFGGVAGLLLAGVVAAVGNVIVNNIAANQGIPLDLTVFRVTWWIVAGALALATLFSALSGFFPALRASRLDPVTALRYE
ncbi:MAG TPA: ATP-binding cassette domain-containing protein [Candidatus Dormibacteraeota bacterium]|nr:ATP-binding cassette domain-containing protein [Candidatus Dormibacteraeota bacterium]